MNLNQRKVLSRFPKAYCESNKVFPRTTIPDCDFTIHAVGGLWGYGRTEAEAWRDAKRNIESREGRSRTPIPEP